jgi:dimethylglycine dehydrogenase
MVSISDVTDDFGVLVLAGPKSRAVLSAVYPGDQGRWLTGRIAEVAGVSQVRLLRVTYVGELGWELHVPRAGMQKVFDALMTAGEPHGIRLFGTYAMNSLRMEKSYRGWGSELTSEVDMFEASMERFIRLDKDDFIGKAASLARRQQGQRMKLVTLEVANTDSDCMGNEPVYSGGKLVGITTSGAFGHAVKKSLALAYVPPELATDGTELDVMVFTGMRKARIIADSIWDPANTRIRA